MLVVVTLIKESSINCGGMRRIQSCPSSAATLAALRYYSEVRYNTPQPTDVWGEFGVAPQQPNPLVNHPQLKLRRTASEWKAYHGHGSRYGTVGPTRHIADFEYSDGTPAPASRRRYAHLHHEDSILVQLIKAGAVVERAASTGYLPRIPGVPEQRAWDPEIPLFLEDADEHGKAPVWHYSSDAVEKHVNAKFEKAGKNHKNLANEHAGESLEPNTMFASYDPASFISEPIQRIEKRRPHWSRRRWNLSDQFLVPKSPQPKNTIKDE